MTSSIERKKYLRVSNIELNTHIYISISRWPVHSPRKLKFSPMKHCLAVGNDAGELLVCYFTPDNLAKPRVSSNQWHHTEIRALHFMADGIYVLTGGDEAVLVFWQLETGFKQFLPRLGGEINSISVSPDHKYYCVGLADNSIRLINSITQKIDQVIQGLQYGKCLSKMKKKWRKKEENINHYHINQDELIQNKKSYYYATIRQQNSTIIWFGSRTKKSKRRIEWCGRKCAIL